MLSRLVALFASLILLFPTESLSQGWLMDGYDATRRNASGVAGPGTPPAHQPIGSIQGTLKRISSDGVLLTIHDAGVTAYRATGIFLWNAAIPGVRDVAVGPEGNIYVSTATSLYALSKDTGVALWPVPHVSNDGDESSPLAVASDGTVFFHTGHSVPGGMGEKLAAIRPDGTHKWETALNFRAYTRIVISPDNAFIYVIQKSGIWHDVTRLSASTGLRTNGSVCTVSDDVYLFDAGGGRVYSTETDLDGTPQLMSIAADLSDCFVLTGSETGRLQAITPQGVLVQRSASGNLVGLSRNGTRLWMSTHTFREVISDSAGVLFGIYLETEFGATVQALDGATGSIRWTAHYDADDIITATVLGNDGALYVVVNSFLWRFAAAEQCVPPNIATQPTNRTVLSGQSVTLSVAAVGADLRYQWYRGASGNTSSPIAGATAASYSTGPVTTTSQFWVRVSNACDHVDSGTATVSVSPIVITGSLQGLVGLVDATKWPVDGPGATIRSIVAYNVLTRRSTNAQVINKPYYEINDLEPGLYVIAARVEYVDNVYDNLDSCQTKSVGCQAAALSKASTGGAAVAVVSAGVTRRIDIRFPPIMVMLHGLYGCHLKWSNTDSSNRWDPVARRGGYISFTPNYNFLVNGDWEYPVHQITNQIASNLESLTSGLSTYGWPSWIAIAHSQGGLIVRALLNVLGETDHRVASLKRLYMLGTPNSGAGGSLGLLGCVREIEELELQFYFNNKYPLFTPIESKNVVAVVGTKPFWWQATFPGDGIVTWQSAFNVYSRPCSAVICNPELRYRIINGKAYHYNHGELGDPVSVEILYYILTDLQSDPPM
jgi:hypothetical protein